MTCLEVRERLPEHATGVLAPSEREGVDRHLRWCAGCRKEARDLERAAATLAFGLVPARVPEGLEDRVVAEVRRVAGRPATRRRARTLAAGLLAAAVAVASLGWGAVMAGRADRFADRAEQAEREQAAAIESFQRVVGQLIPGNEVSDSDTRLGQLAPQGGGVGGGFALQLVSPTILDFVMVIVSGVEPGRTGGLPFRVVLENALGERLRVGRIHELDAVGRAEIFRQYRTQSLAGFTTVHVVDASGEPVLTGTIDQRA